MFKNSLIPLAFVTSAAWAFSSILAIPSIAQAAQTEQTRPLTILKQKDFSTTLDALQALTHRSIPLEEVKADDQNIKTPPSPQGEVKAEENAKTDEKKAEKVASEKDASHEKTNKDETDKIADDLKKAKSSEKTEKVQKAESKSDSEKKPEQKVEQKQETNKETKEEASKEAPKESLSEKEEKPTSAVEQNEKAENEEPVKPQRVVLPRQYIDLHFANYKDTRLFLKNLKQKFGDPVAACSRSSINLYRLPDDFTLRVHMTNLDPDDVSPGSSVDGVNGIRMMLVDGKLSDDCDIDTLKPEERISFGVLKQLTQDVLNAGDNLDEKKVETLISVFGTPKREEKDCFITFSIKPEKDLPLLDISISVLKPDCKPKSGYAGLLISYEPQENNGIILPTDPAMSIKMARALEQTFNMEALHNIAYLWKNGDIFGVIRTPVSLTLPMTFQIEEAKGKLTMEVGRWFGSDEAHYQTLWNAGEQPYGGLTTSEEFIP